VKTHWKLALDSVWSSERGPISIPIGMRRRTPSAREHSTHSVHRRVHRAGVLCHAERPGAHLVQSWSTATAHSRSPSCCHRCVGQGARAWL